MSNQLSDFYLHQARRAHGTFARVVEYEDEARAPMPEWNDLSDSEQVAWAAVALELCRPVESTGSVSAAHMVEEFAASLHEELGIDPDRVNAEETAEVVQQVLDHHSLELAHRRP